MYGSILKVALAFIEGFVLILSPCILPILPLVLTGSLYGRKSKPLGIIVGFILIFTLVTLASRWLVGLTHINPNFLRYISYTLLILLGISMLSDYLYSRINYYLERITPTKTVSEGGGGFFAGIIFGGLVGLIWTPCVGPILAAVIVQTVIAQTTLESLLIVLAFAVGVAIPMLFIALLGRQFILKIKLAKKASIIRKSLGILIILSVFLLIYSPNLFLVSTVNQNNVASNANLSFETGYMAPPIQGTAWINSPPLNLANLKNKVILIDFWTYSCINCIRTLPYLKNWYQKYRDKGLIIIGVHSPEFAFEHDLNNVIKAVKKYDITYPVVLDNNFQTWQNYQNQFWPAHYLIDRTGKVVYQHAGEGEYAVTENNIRHLLGLAPTNPSQKEARQSEPLSPEMYFGFERAREFTSPETPAIDKSQTYSYPTDITRNRWALKGMWVMTLHNIISGGQGASIKVAFHASQVFAVMGNQAKPVVVKVLLNGKIVHDNAGDDVMNGQVVVNSSRLYHLVRLPADADGVLELIASAPGLEMYTFTFGGK